jgi:hypothetical protein
MDGPSDAKSLNGPSSYGIQGAATHLPGHASAVTAVAAWAEGPAGEEDGPPLAVHVCAASKGGISMCLTRACAPCTEASWTIAAPRSASPPAAAAFDPSGHLVALAVGRVVLVLRSE